MIHYSSKLEDLHIFTLQLWLLGSDVSIEMDWHRWSYHLATLFS